MTPWSVIPAHLMKAFGRHPDHPGVRAQLMKAYPDEDEAYYDMHLSVLHHWFKSGRDLFGLSDKTAELLVHLSYERAQQGKTPVRLGHLPVPGSLFYDKTVFFSFKMRSDSFDARSSDKVPNVTLYAAARSHGTFSAPDCTVHIWGQTEHGRNATGALAYPVYVRETTTMAPVFGNMLAALGQPQVLVQPRMKHEKKDEEKRPSRGGVSASRKTVWEIDEEGLFLWRRKYHYMRPDGTHVAPDGREYGEDGQILGVAAPKASPVHIAPMAVHHRKEHKWHVWILPEHVREGEKPDGERLNQAGTKLVRVKRPRRESYPGSKSVHVQMNHVRTTEE